MIDLAKFKREYERRIDAECAALLRGQRTRRALAWLEDWRAAVGACDESALARKSLEDRVAAVERELRESKQRRSSQPPPPSKE